MYFGSALSIYASEAGTRVCAMSVMQSELRMRGSTNAAMRLEEDYSSRSDIRDSDNGSDDDEGIRGLSTDQVDEYGEVVNVEGKKPNTDVEIPDDSCWNQFLRVMRGVWKTRYTEDTEGNHDLYIITTIRELILYLIFLAVLSVITSVETGLTQFHYANQLTNAITVTKPADGGNNFKGLSTIGDIWVFLEGPFVDSLYVTKWDNGKNMSKDDQNMLLLQSKLLGVPRIRQVKVRNDSCNIQDDFKETIAGCYSSFTATAENKEAFGPKTGPGWTYMEAKDTDTRDYSGTHGVYPAGGFVADLGRDGNTTKAVIAELKSGLWIRRDTRAVFVDFTVYNANVNIFCVIKLVVELPPTGGTRTSYVFQALKLIRYVEPYDYFVLFCEILFVFYIIYYIVEETLEIKKHRIKYLHNAWNWIDLCVIVISILCMIFHVYRTVTVQGKLEILLKNVSTFPDFDFLRFSNGMFNNAVALTTFLCMIKIFKYISFNRTMSQLSSTLAGCARDLSGFAIMFFIVFFAFAQLGYLLFGTQIRDFSEFGNAVFTLFRIILGDFNFHDMEAAHRVLGPFYFLMYVFFVFFVLINMFLAIVNDTYSEVKENLGKEEDEIRITDFFKQRAANILSRLRVKKSQAGDIREVIAECMAIGGALDFERFRINMMSRGFTRSEIQTIFENYDSNSNLQLDPNEQRKMFNDMTYMESQFERTNPFRGSIVSIHKVMSDKDGEEAEEEKAEEEEERRQPDNLEEFVTPHDMGMLSDRLEAMEQSVRAILPKIDDLIDSLGITEEEVESMREPQGAAGGPPRKR